MSEKKVVEQEKLSTADKHDEQGSKPSMRNIQDEIKASSLNESMVAKFSEQYGKLPTSGIREEVLKTAGVGEYASIAAKLSEQSAKIPTYNVREELLKTSILGQSAPIAAKFSEQYAKLPISSIREEVLKTAGLGEYASMAAKLKEQSAKIPTYNIREEVLKTAGVGEYASMAAKFSEQYGKLPTSGIREEVLKTAGLGESASMTAKFASLHKDIEEQRNRYLNMFSTKAPEITHPEKNFVRANSYFIEQQKEIQKEKEEKRERELRQLEIFEDMHNTQCQIIQLARTTSSESAVERKRAHRITIASVAIAIISLIITAASLIPPYFDFFKIEPKFIESDKDETIELPPVQPQTGSIELDVKPIK
ncbi:hypothetical protein ACJO1Z_02330 [Vibrio parahaemolyticus]|uniref:hypothetical protein n=3 Tax=Vibrio parahaemolyticus TaxID=670 RepID=UPI001B816BBE|nr:hypothetical protein [Vibrio parahaemolyticus]